MQKNENQGHKRIVVISDLHCGHRTGLTPPKFVSERPGERKFQAVREVCWDAFSQGIKKVSPFDILIVNGDVIDGHGEKSGGAELAFADINDQKDMAIKVVKFCQKIGQCEETMFTYGTAYHAGQKFDYERDIAMAVGATIESHIFGSCQGVVFDIKHHTNSSSVPHGRCTPIDRAGLWNDLWYLKNNEQPLASVIVRSHTHYLKVTMDTRRTSVITPALQGYGTKYGARRMEGTVDWGFIWFDLEDGSCKLSWYVPALPIHQASVTNW